MLPKKGVEKSVFAPADPRQYWLSERQNKTESGSFICCGTSERLLRVIARAEYTHALPLNDLPSFRFSTLFSEVTICESGSSARWCTRGLLPSTRGGVGTGCRGERGTAKPLPRRWHLALLYCGWPSLQICGEETVSYGRAAIPVAQVWTHRGLQPVLSVQHLS